MSRARLATVLVPTTGERGPLLLLSVGSILAQSVRDIEVFILGDGVGDAARATIANLARRDPRIRFFDHPKHARRGEPHRHAALAEATGEIVCYLTDRDLMLPNHVEAMAGLLADADFGHTLRFNIDQGGGFSFAHTLDIDDPGDRKTAVRTAASLIPLSFAGHTLGMYRRLPFGWRTTPEGEFTDRYMWKQFLAEPGCRTATGTHPTILYFNRGSHPGWSVAQRLPELECWAARLDQPGWLSGFAEEVRDGAIRDRARIARDLASGRGFRTTLARAFPRATSALKRLPGANGLLKR